MAQKEVGALREELAAFTRRQLLLLKPRLIAGVNSQDSHVDADLVGGERGEQGQGEGQGNREGGEGGIAERGGQGKQIDDVLVGARDWSMEGGVGGRHTQEKYQFRLRLKEVGAGGVRRGVGAREWWR